MFTVGSLRDHNGVVIVDKLLEQVTCGAVV